MFDPAAFADAARTLTNDRPRTRRPLSLLVVPVAAFLVVALALLVA